MNAVYAILFLNACCGSIIRAYLHPPHSRFTYKASPALVRNASRIHEPLQTLHLTPFIDKGKLDEAKNLSLVRPSLGGIQSYTGYLTVNRDTESHLFFWFIPKTEPEAKLPSSPLLLWLQGGPGMSSIYGLFMENGPFFVTEDHQLHEREYAWTKECHMLYVDQPVGSGFSYTEDEKNGYISNETQVAEHLYEALRQFYKVFWQMKKHDFYIAGESYAGKYVPALAYKIHTSKVVEFPLTGLIIGNGASDPLNLVPASEYMYQLGLIDKNQHTELEPMEEKIMSLVRSGNLSQASIQFGRYQKSINVLNEISVFDYTMWYEGEMKRPFVKFVKSYSTRKSIHAGTVDYDMMSQTVYGQFMREDFMYSVRSWVEELLEHYPILYYNGHFDLLCSHANSQKFLRSLRWSGASKFGLTKRRKWLVNGKVAGYYWSASNLVDVLVRNAGHMAISDQPKNALELIRSFIVEKKFTNRAVVKQ